MRTILSNKNVLNDVESVFKQHWNLMIAASSAQAACVNNNKVTLYLHAWWGNIQDVRGFK